MLNKQKGKHKMKNKKMYVWRIRQNKNNELYTVASTELNELDTARYNKAREAMDNSAPHSKEAMDFYIIIEQFKKTYLTRYNGDIAVSEWPTYEECMEHIAQQGHEVNFDHIEAPTQH